MAVHQGISSAGWSFLVLDKSNDLLYIIKDDSEKYIIGRESDIEHRWQTSKVD